MARLTGPLLSLDASGSIGGMMTFAKNKGRNYVRQLVIPANPQSDLQWATRAIMRSCSRAWAPLDPAIQAAWAVVAEASKISGANAYTKRNMLNLRNMIGQQQAPDGNTPDEPDAPTLTAANGEIRQVTLTFAAGAGGTSYGFWLFRTEVDAPDPAVANILYATAGLGGGVYVDRDVVPGTLYHYRALAFDEAGKLGDMCADQTATPVAA